MNQRIDELYKQSFIEVQDENSFPCMTFSKQKFAELIVRECDMVLSEDDGATHHSELLFTHFGLES